jgi:hypothetical protein
MKASAIRPHLMILHSTHLGLPICSLNRRSFCVGFGPPRAIEIFSQGGREDGRARQRREVGARAAAYEPQTRSPPEPSEEIFFDSVLRIEKCVLAFTPPSRLPSSRPPCESRRLSRRAGNTTAARSARSARPCDATLASASDLRLGSHKMCRIIRRSFCRSYWSVPRSHRTARLGLAVMLIARGENLEIHREALMADTLAAR